MEANVSYGLRGKEACSFSDQDRGKAEPRLDEGGNQALLGAMWHVSHDPGGLWIWHRGFDRGSFHSVRATFL